MSKWHRTLQAYERRERNAKHRLERFLRQGYGKRCKDYEPGCACCEAWKAFDVLFPDYADRKAAPK